LFDLRKQRLNYEYTTYKTALDLSFNRTPISVLLIWHISSVIGGLEGFIEECFYVENR
jgi:hypothetical protein